MARFEYQIVSRLARIALSAAPSLPSISFSSSPRLAASGVKISSVISMLQKFRDGLTAEDRKSFDRMDFKSQITYVQLSMDELC